MGTCVARDSACVRCTTKPAPEADHQCNALCEIAAGLLTTEKGHEALHRAEHCESCGTHKGHPGTDENTDRVRCTQGRCTILACRTCGAENGKWGPIDCRCETTRWSRAAGWAITPFYLLAEWVRNRRSR